MVLVLVLLHEYAIGQPDLHQQRLGTKGTSIFLDWERCVKLNELGKMIRRFYYYITEFKVKVKVEVGFK